MTIITYENEFFDEVQSLESVQELNAKIDADVNGLGTTLKDCLEAAAG